LISDTAKNAASLLYHEHHFTEIFLSLKDRMSGLGFSHGERFMNEYFDLTGCQGGPQFGFQILKNRSLHLAGAAAQGAAD
jgi:hypothetical protein